jgi:hypothetical protein
MLQLPFKKSKTDALVLYQGLPMHATLYKYLRFIRISRSSSLNKLVLNKIPNNNNTTARKQSNSIYLIDRIHLSLVHVHKKRKLVF